MASHGLAFLTKKTFHPGRMDQMEEVWKREQKQLAEQRRIAELQKEIEEERQIEELQAIQEKALGRKKSERLDWMYQAGGVVASAEDFLTKGKVAEEKQEMTLGQLKSLPGASFITAEVNQAQEAATRIREDPLLVIKKKRQAAITDVLTNPVLMAKLRKEKKAKKDKDKKKKKKKKKKAKSGSGSSSGSASGGQEKASTKKEGDRSDRNDRNDRPRHDDRPRDGRDGHDDRRRDGHDDRRRDGDRGQPRGGVVRRRSRSRSRSRDRTKDDGDRPDNRGEKRPREDASSKPGPSASRESPPRKRARSRSPSQEGRSYGLTVKAGARPVSPERARGPQAEGPSARELEKQEGERRRREREERRRSHKGLKDDDREKRLRDMVLDAEVHEDSRWKRVSAHRAAQEKEEDQSAVEKARRDHEKEEAGEDEAERKKREKYGEKHEAAFIKDMQRATYMAEDVGAGSLGERIGRQRSQLQRGLGKENFTKR